MEKIVKQFIVTNMQLALHFSTWVFVFFYVPIIFGLFRSFSSISTSQYRSITISFYETEWKQLTSLYSALHSECSTWLNYSFLHVAQFEWTFFFLLGNIQSDLFMHFLQKKTSVNRARIAFECPRIKTRLLKKFKWNKEKGS